MNSNLDFVGKRWQTTELAKLFVCERGVAAHEDLGSNPTQKGIFSRALILFRLNNELET